MRKNVLSENAVEAWSIAKKYCLCIKNGLATLQYRKLFVTSLHNATELFIKAAMIKVNDLRVLIPSSVDSSGTPAKEYYSATDLNDFIYNEINNANGNFSKKYKSCEFNKLSEYHKDLFKTYYQNNPDAKNVIGEALGTLKTLRNNETHFSIDSKEFLSEKEYVQLHNFMIEFYKLLKAEVLLPFVGEPIEQHKFMLEFTETPLDNKRFSYKKALLDSENACEIAKQLYKMPCAVSLDNPFQIADNMIQYSGSLKDYDSFDEILSYIHMMIEHDVLSVNEDIEEFKIENETYHSTETNYVFKGWNFEEDS
mgnify:CR=1 FL=1